ncbi:YagK/YfjJ domain-containing protein [Aeromonas intestinalis]
MPDHIGLTSSIQAARQVGTKRKQGKVYGAITKDEQIEIDGLSYPINSAKSGCHVEWLQRLIRHAVAVEQVYQRVLIVRLELRNPPEGGDNKAIRAFMDKASKAIRGKYDHKAGYMWAREQETAKGHHYHVALLLDGDRVMAGQPVFELVEPIWRNMGGSLAKAKTKKGAENLPYFMMIGRGAAPLTDATYWLSYLTKPRGKGYRADYAQDFGTAQLSTAAKPAKKAKIVKVAPIRGWVPSHHFMLMGSGITFGQFIASGMDKAAANLWGPDMNPGAIGKVVNAAKETARRIVLRRRGDEYRNYQALRRRRLAADKAKVIAMLLTGATLQETADKLGASFRNVAHWSLTDPAVIAKREAEQAAYEARQEQAREMFKQGATLEAVRVATGLRNDKVIEIRAGLGLTGKKPLKRAEGLRLLAAGHSSSEVAEMLGVSKSTANEWRSEAGIAGVTTQHTPETRGAVIAMRAAGATYQAIADHHQIPLGSVVTICRAAKKAA